MIGNFRFLWVILVVLGFAPMARAQATATAVAGDAVELRTTTRGEFRVERQTGFGPSRFVGTLTSEEPIYDGNTEAGQKHTYKLTPKLQAEIPSIGGNQPARDLRLPVGGGRLVLIADPGQDNYGDHALWIEPVVIVGRTTRPLLAKDAAQAAVAWQDEYNGNYRIAGQRVTRALWAHAPSEYVFELPDNATEFRTRVGVAGGGGSVTFRARFEPRGKVEPLTVVITLPALEESKGSTTYYVDAQSGNDARNGTSAETAFRTLARLSRIKFAAGDRILLKAGVAHAGRLSIHGDGTAEAPIAIDSYGNGVAVIAPPAALDAAVVLDRTRHVQFGKLRIGDKPQDWSGRRVAIRWKLDDPATFNGQGLASIEVARNSDAPYNALAIDPADETWNLSRHRQIDLQLRRPAAVASTVTLRLEGIEASVLRNCVSDVIDLRDDTPQAVRLPIIVRPLDPGYQYFNPFFMYTRSMDVRDGTVDPTAISRILVRVERGGAVVESLALSGNGPSLPVPFFPFIDEFGQYIHGHWPGKVYSEEGLKASRDVEAADIAANPGPADWDEYGGWANGPQLKATGHFYAAKVDGKWWLVDPAGRLFFSHGPTGVGFGGDVTPVSEREFWFTKLPPRSGDTQRFWSDGHGARFMYYEHKGWTGVDIVDYTLTRKYGSDYASTISDLSHKRLRSWGFNTMGNWSDGRVYLNGRTPYTVAIHAGPLNFGHHHDVFHPSFRDDLRRRLEEEKSTTALDPMNIGYFVDNELHWAADREGIENARRAVRSSPQQAAKQEMLKDLKAKYSTIEALNTAWRRDYQSWDQWLERTDLPDERVQAVTDDLLAFTRKFVRIYFEICRDEVKRVAPNKMYLGCRFHGHIDGGLMKMAAEYCDVISYNIYDSNPAARLNQYNGVIDKPILVGEWGFGSDYRQTPFGRTAEEWNPDERPNYFRNYMNGALRHPLLVGAHFFQYRDQPISGRPDGEAILRGFMNATDTPHDELVRANRAIAENMYKLRSQQ